MTLRGQELLGHIKKEWQIKMMAEFFFIAHKRVLNFMRNPKLVHILVLLVASAVPKDYEKQGFHIK